jgi:uncharacterized Zn-binding protein involved in type VI secretion
MAKLSRVGDTNEAGGAILRGAATVFANGIKIGLHVSPISPHAPWGKPHPPHEAASTTTASPTVFAESSQVLRVGSGNTCGHSIVQGSPDVFCP